MSEPEVLWEGEAFPWWWRRLSDGSWEYRTGPGHPSHPWRRSDAGMLADVLFRALAAEREALRDRERTLEVERRGNDAIMRELTKLRAAALAAVVAWTHEGTCLTCAEVSWGHTARCVAGRLLALLPADAPPAGEVPP